MLLGLVSEKIITCDLDLDPAQYYTVVIDQVSGQIVDILADREPEGIPIVRFPEGVTLMPGFIDCHVHLTIATDDYQLDHLRLSSADKALRALKVAQGLLQAGFTTLRSAGDADTYFPSFAVAKSIEKGDFVGPRIVGAGHYISVTGGGGGMYGISSDAVLRSSIQI
jgi:imidazolonepropionase-like amidohydrolase